MINGVGTTDGPLDMVPIAHIRMREPHVIGKSLLQFSNVGFHAWAAQIVKNVNRLAVFQVAQGNICANKACAPCNQNVTSFHDLHHQPTRSKLIPHLVKAVFRRLALQPTGKITHAILQSDLGLIT